MSKTAISVLQEYLVKHRRSAPTYLEIGSAGNITPTFTIRCSCEGLSVDGKGPNKKIAKHRAAGKMIECLRKEKNYNIDYWSSEVEECGNGSMNNSFLDSSSTSPGLFINHIGKLSELCIDKKLLAPVYREIPSTDIRPAHLPNFTIECKIGALTVTKTANTKKQAKQDSAEAMRELLQSKYQIAKPLDDLQYTPIPSVTELDLSIEHLKISEAPELAAATEKAKNLFPQLKKSLGGNMNYNPKNITLNNFHKAFKASFDSKTLERFHEVWKFENFESMTSKTKLEIFFMRICKILDITYVKGTLKTKSANYYAVFYKLESQPEFIEVGMGESLEVAQINALIRITAAINLLLI